MLNFNYICNIKLKRKVMGREQNRFSLLALLMPLMLALLMPVELAHQKADKHLCVALRHKVRIRLHPSMAFQAEIFVEYCHIKRKGHSFS